MIIMINSKFRTLKANISNNLIPITSDIHYNRLNNEKICQEDFIMSYISDFERCWKKFTDTLGGALIEESEKQTLTYSVASIILSNASMAWSLSYDECGRWLSSYKKENPEKGELAEQILTKDMRFTELPPKKNLPEAVNFIAPLGGAIVGGGIAHLLGTNIFIQVASAAVPAVLLYPTTKSIGNMIKRNNKEAVLTEYMAQLEKYRKSVISVISED